MNKMILNHACFMRNPVWPTGLPAWTPERISSLLQYNYPYCLSLLFHGTFVFALLFIFFFIQFFFYLNFWSKVVGVQCTAALDAIKENMEHFNEWKFIAISALISIFIFNMNIDFSPRPKKGFSHKEVNLPLANRNHIHSFVIFESHL